MDTSFIQPALSGFETKSHDRFQSPSPSASWILSLKETAAQWGRISSYVPSRIERHFSDKDTDYVFAQKRKSSRLTEKLSHIRKAIADSRWLLDLDHDWDEQGAEPYSAATRKRASEFLWKHAVWMVRKWGIVMPAPKLLPGPNGSIDIHWDTPRFEMLINVPKDYQDKASFYADDRGSLCIKGTLDVSKYNRGLLTWFSNL